MKPGSKDKKYQILITGQELVELKKFTGDMMEAFGLDQRIENYKGTRSIGFYRWDLDCLVDVTELALEDTDEYPERSGPGYEAMKELHRRVTALWEEAYGEL